LIFIERNIVLDQTTKNGRIYPKEIMEKAIKNLQDKINKRQVIGFVGNERTMLHASHFVTDLKINKNNQIEAELEFLNTPNGQFVQSLAHDQKILKKMLDPEKRNRASKIYLNMSFTGTVNNGVVGNDMTIKSIDLVVE